MKIKQFAAVILAVLMIISAALPIMAADPSGSVCELIAPGQTSGTQYADFYSALKAINADGYTIKMLVSAYSFAPSQTDIRYNFTWDGEYAAGQRCKITGTASAYIMMIHDGATFKNLDITSYLGVRYSNTESANPFNLINVDWRVSSNLVTNIQGTVGTNVQTMNLTNCRLDTTSTNTATPIIGIYTGVTGGSPCDVKINLHNSVMTQNGGAKNHAGNRSVIFANKATSVTVTLTGESAIHYNSFSDPGTAASAMFVDSGNCGKFTVNLGSETYPDASKVTLKLGADEKSDIGASTLLTERAFFNGANNFHVNDMGGKWIVDAAVAAKGFQFGLPESRVLAFGDKESLYAPNVKYTANKTLTLSLIYPFEQTPVTNGEGAAIRTIAPDGIRFTTYVDKDVYELLGKSARFGAKVTTVSLLAAANGSFATAKGLETSENLNWKTEGESFYTVLTGINAASYRTQYAVTGFVTLNYANGVTKTFYADYVEKDNARSIYYVATEALADTKYTYTDAQTEYLREIVNTAENKTSYVEDGEINAVIMPTSYQTAPENYYPDALWESVKECFEDASLRSAQNATFGAYGNGTSPYAMRDVYTISDCKITSITIPVISTKAADENGDFVLTVYVAGNSWEGLTKISRTITLKVNGAKYGLTENSSSVYKMVKVDLSKSPIYLSETQTLAFFNPDGSDTLIPAYIPADTANSNLMLNKIKEEFPQALAFVNNVGTADRNASMNSLLFNFEFVRTYVSEDAYNEMIAAKAAKDAEYAEMLAVVKSAYGDKYLSVVGDSISTYGGINNNTDYNLTIGSNAVHYPTVDSNFSGYEQTYWGRLLTDLNMNLAVNNSWSGSTAMASGTSGIVYRSNQLHRDGGTASNTSDDIAPDVILIYLGINDIHSDQPVGDLYTILNTNDGRTDQQKVATWYAGVQQKYSSNGTWSDWFAAYAIAISNMKAKYGDAEIWCINHMQQNDYRSTDDEIERANRCIAAIAEYFEVNLIDQTTENEVNTSNCHIYTNDWNCLHPNAAGHNKMKEMIVRAMYKKLMAK